ncbi:MAG: putative metalloprotease CJM1_0395 family protein [Alphaproteobacteria bacterium]|jgi:hypothetical protein|nr:putative metalloprotease CJM1_0395 family protein [Alphaproteobacteria bacterium]
MMWNLQRLLAVMMVAGALGGQAVAAPPEESSVPPIRRDENGKIVRVAPDERRPEDRATGQIGTIQRGANGRIEAGNPDGALVPAPRAAATPRLSPASRGAVSNLGALARMARADQAAKARAQQLRIARILREEVAAKLRGAAVDSRGTTRRERFLIDQLRARDREVRAHELLHYRTGRPHTRAPEYWFVVGPKGRRYAITGVTLFDTTLDPGDREGAIRKLQALKRAALAPRNPSRIDLRVARDLTRLIGDLRR